MAGWVKNLLTYLLCVVIAAVIWFAHAMNSVRSATFPVAVTYYALPSGISLTAKLPSTLTVEVRDAGYRLKAYKDDPLAISVNLSRQAFFSDSTMEISSNTLRSEISGSLKGTTQLQSVTPDGITCRLHRLSKE